MNPYRRDAELFLRLAAHALDRGSQRLERIEFAMLFALGVERLLKGILFEINPLYVFVRQDFAHTLPVMYPSCILADEKKSKELAAKPDGNVCTMRAATLRAKHVSQAARAHQGILFNLADVRDLIAHCDLDMLPDERLSRIANDDFPRLVTAFVDEHALDPTCLDGKTNSITSPGEDFPLKRLTDRIIEHKRLFASRRADAGHMDVAKRQTDQHLQAGELGDYFYVSSKCPACDSAAVVRGEVDYDLCDGDAVPMGVGATGLNCFFCGFCVSDYYEIDILKLHDVVDPPFIPEEYSPS